MSRRASPPKHDTQQVPLSDGTPRGRGGALHGVAVARIDKALADPDHLLPRTHSRVLLKLLSFSRKLLGVQKVQKREPSCDGLESVIGRCDRVRCMAHKLLRQRGRARSIARTLTRLKWRDGGLADSPGCLTVSHHPNFIRIVCLFAPGYVAVKSGIGCF